MAEPLLHTLRQLSADSGIEIGLLAYDEALIGLIRSTSTYGAYLEYLEINY
jgi:hypothetical protein